MGDRCRFEVADVRDFRALDNAVVLTNPPYGERLGDAPRRRVWRARWVRYGRRTLRRGCMPSRPMRTEQHFGKKAARRRKIYNGMIPCQLYMYFEQPKRERK